MIWSVVRPLNPSLDGRDHRYDMVRTRQLAWLTHDHDHSRVPQDVIQNRVMDAIRSSPSAMMTAHSRLYCLHEPPTVYFSTQTLRQSRAAPAFVHLAKQAYRQTMICPWQQEGPLPASEQAPRHMWTSVDALWQYCTAQQVHIPVCTLSAPSVGWPWGYATSNTSITSVTSI